MWHTAILGANANQIKQEETAVEEEKRVKDSSKKIVKKDNHFATKCDSKRAFLLKQSFYLLLSRETSLSTVIIPTFETLPPKV